MLLLIWHTYNYRIINLNNYLKVFLLLAVYGVYGFLTILLSSKKIKGPKNIDNTEPMYADNGFETWILSITIFISLCYLYELDIFIFDNFFLITLINTFISLLFVYYLFIVGERNIKMKNLKCL